MRLISMLIVLTIIGFLLYKQLGGSSSSIDKLEGIPEAVSESAPRVPTKVKDIKNFEGQINSFVQDNADKRARQIEEAEGR